MPSVSKASQGYEFLITGSIVYPADVVMAGETFRVTNKEEARCISYLKNVFLYKIICIDMFLLIDI